MRATRCIAERLRLTSADFVLRTDCAFEFLSACRQSVARPASRSDRQCDGPLDSGDRLGRDGSDGRHSFRRQSDAAVGRAEEFRRRGRTPGRLRYGLSGGGPVPGALKKAWRDELASAAYRKLRPERARRLRRARLSRVRARRASRRGWPGAAGQRGANLQRGRAGGGGRRNRRDLHSRRLHEGLLGPAAKRPPRPCAAAGCTPATPGSSIARATSRCAAVLRTDQGRRRHLVSRATSRTRFAKFQASRRRRSSAFPTQNSVSGQSPA